VILTLNLLRSSCKHPSVSAHAFLFSNYNFNCVPIAPPGTKVVAHVSSESCTTFGQHGKVGWYIGPSPEHYWCYRCYFPDTRKERRVLTVHSFPEKPAFPSLTSSAYLKQMAEDMLSLLSPTPKSSYATPPLSFGPPILNAFAKIATILGRAIQRPLAPALTPRSPVSPPRVPIVSKPIVATKPPAHSSHQQIFHFAQSFQYDPTVAGKMFHPVTGRAAETINSLLSGPDCDILLTSLANEWGCCAQGVSKNRPAMDHVLGNGTVYFIPPHKVPADHKVTYANFCMHYASRQG
jgi:hypothetical protein